MRICGLGEEYSDPNKTPGYNIQCSPPHLLHLPTIYLPLALLNFHPYFLIKINCTSQHTAAICKLVMVEKYCQHNKNTQTKIDFFAIITKLLVKNQYNKHILMAYESF